jgi:hypothetical protein
MGVRWWLLLVVPAIILGYASTAQMVTIYVILVVVGYVVSLVLHPHRRCRNCKGTGREPGGMFTWGDRACTRCGGSPRHRRWGVRLLSPDKPVWAERSAAKAKDRAGRPR